MRRFFDSILLALIVYSVAVPVVRSVWPDRPEKNAPESSPPAVIPLRAVTPLQQDAPSTSSQLPPQASPTTEVERSDPVDIAELSTFPLFFAVPAKIARPTPR